MTPRLPPENARGAIPLGRRELAALAAFGTAAVCNAVTEMAPERRGEGFTTGRLVAVRPDAPPVAGYARTVTVRAGAPSRPEPQDDEILSSWLAHVARSPKPAVAVIQHVGPVRAACWGYLLSRMFAAVGGLGIVTDGAIRDVGRLPDGFQVVAAGIRPARGMVRWASFGGEVDAAGLSVADGDIVVADANGATVVPPEFVRDIPTTIERMREHDAELLAACARPGVEFAALKQLISGQRPSRWCS